MSQVQRQQKGKAGVASSIFSLGYGGAVASVAGVATMGLAHVGDAVLHGLLVDEVAEIDLLGYCVGSDWCEQGE